MTIPNKIFIVPYRNRVKDKMLFDKQMKYILDDLPNDSYEIFFVNQNDIRPFNRGAMKNIGFLVMRDKYPNDYKNITFIFNDIDTYPVKKNLLNYDTTIGVVKHFYGFTFALGGIFSIKGVDFEKSGGFPNFWGWGLEDSIMQEHVLRAGLKINRSNFFSFENSNITQRKDIKSRLTTKKEYWRYANKDFSETFKDVKKLVYNIEKEFINVSNFIVKYKISDDIFYIHDTRNSNPKLDPKFNPNPNADHNLNIHKELMPLFGTSHRGHRSSLKMNFNR